MGLPKFFLFAHYSGYLQEETGTQFFRFFVPFTRLCKNCTQVEKERVVHENEQQDEKCMLHPNILKKPYLFLGCKKYLEERNKIKYQIQCKTFHLLSVHKNKKYRHGSIKKLSS